MIVVTGRVQTTAELREELTRTAQTMCEASRRDEGCLGYRFYEDTEQPHHFLFLEEWENDDALQAHFAQPHTADFMAAIGGLMVGPPDAAFHTVGRTRRLGRRGLTDED